MLADGIIKKCREKSTLVNKLEGNVEPAVTIPGESAFIVDCLVCV